MSPLRRPALVVGLNAVAAMRQSRLTRDPDPVAVAGAAVAAGADAVIARWHDDGRDVQVSDLERLAAAVGDGLHLVTGSSNAALELARHIRPARWYLAPSQRHEFTPEGGFDVVRWPDEAAAACEHIRASGVGVAIVVDPESAQIDECRARGADAVLLNSGSYAMASSTKAMSRQAQRLELACAHARGIGLAVHSGRGLNYTNIPRLAAMPGFTALHAGHAVVARAVTDGIALAVRAMLVQIERPEAT